jgi:ribonuclease-3
MDRQTLSFMLGVWRSLSSQEVNMDSSQGNLEEHLTLREMAQRLGLTFNDLHLFRRALVHRSYVNEHPEVLQDNERLEFLGDAVLDFLVGAWLYNHFPEMAEGALTRMRAALVGNQQLAEFSRQIGLGSLMLLGRGEIDGGGRKRDPLLGSSFEALIGALYLDQDIPAVEKFISPLLSHASRQILAEEKDQDPKSIFQEWVQSQGFGTPQYRTVSSEGPDHEKIFTIEVHVNGQVYGIGQGSSKRTAAKEAARQALHSLGLK